MFLASVLIFNFEKSCYLKLAFEVVRREIFCGGKVLVRQHSSRHELNSGDPKLVGTSQDLFLSNGCVEMHAILPGACLKALFGFSFCISRTKFIFEEGFSREMTSVFVCAVF